MRTVHHSRIRRIGAAFGLFTALALLSGGLSSHTSAVAPSPHMSLNCADGRSLCAEVHDSESVFGEGVYVGHDEPSVLFYSNKPGSGNSNRYRMRLPKEPPTLPNQAGTAGTFNFQLHPAFWFGMALCDDQSAPNPGPGTTPCVPNSDGNIFDSADKSDPHFIGKHPGTAFLELQFYPPGWAPLAAGISCDARRWCAAMAIFSLSQNLNTGQVNNAACLAVAGIEPANYAFITLNGVAHAPANPVDSTLDTFTPNPATDLFMNGGDELSVDLHDTPDGLKVVIRDDETEQTGSMTASVANQFGKVKWDPAAKTCTNIPSAYHPMYSTSSEHTRVPWAAHSYNIAFSDEIGHFEYCGNVTAKGGCNIPKADADDVGCFSAAQSLRVKIGGCTGSDIDFDGVPYQHTWPGSLTNAALDRQLNPQSVLFTSPLFNGEQQYERVAFEADLPRIEATCNRTTGAGCVNPPPGANFYPLFTTRNGEDACRWQLGGVNIPGTTNTFGGSSTTEFGGLLQLVYPSPGPTGIVRRFNDFRRVLDHNPCTGEADNEQEGGDN